MPSFNRDSNRFGKRDFGNRGFGGGRDGDRPQMHDAVCSDCGDSCEVPFKPNGKKPVFCRDCFKRQDNNDFGGDSYGSDRRDSGRDYGRDFERPRYEQPRFDKPRFDKPFKGQESGDHGKDAHKEQHALLSTKLDTLGYKLDQVIKALAELQSKGGKATPQSAAAPEKNEKPAAKTAEVKEAAPKASKEPKAAKAPKAEKTVKAKAKKAKKA